MSREALWAGWNRLPRWQTASIMHSGFAPTWWEQEVTAGPEDTMLTFLFWNMGGKRKKETREQRAAEAEREKKLRSISANLARLHDVDLLMLAECPIATHELLVELNRGTATSGLERFREPDTNSLCERIVIFPRFPQRFLIRRSEDDKYTGRLIRLPEPRQEIILFVAHLGSKLYKSEASQILSMPGFRGAIRDVERKVRHERTVLVGDLNQNPFEAGIVGAEGLNATMTRHVALKEKRTVDRQSHSFFYNPMWSHFGDSTHEVRPPGTSDHEPPGTCYYPAAESRWYYWNMFDQVLLRPALLPLFKNKDLRILIGDGESSLLTPDGLPDRRAYSDHLPILFRLDV